jgi:DNA polymerase III epsilon subunit-like protein
MEQFAIFVVLILIFLMIYFTARMLFGSKDQAIPEYLSSPLKVDLDTQKRNRFKEFIEQSAVKCISDKASSFFVLDIETTGLPKDRDGLVSDHDNWPRIVSASMLLYDFEERLIDSFYCLVKQDGHIPEEAIAIHNISTEKANIEGVFIGELILKIQYFASRSKFLIAHNLDFDLKVILSEFSRESYKNPFTKHRKICTMKSGKKFCDLPQLYYSGLKNPKLTELVFECFGVKVEEDQLHNAEYDAKLAAASFFYLAKIGQIKIEIDNHV